MIMNSNIEERGRAQLPPNVQSALWLLRAYIQRHGMRFTRQRQLILQRAIEYEGHFDVEQFYESLRKTSPSSSHRGIMTGVRPSLASVYRTLELLCKAGVLKEVLRDSGRTHYEAVYGHAHHDHMICVECGRIIEFCDERIEQLQRTICRKHRFKALAHGLSIRGICEDCLAAAE